VASLVAELVALEAVRFVASRASTVQPVLYGKCLEYALLSLTGTIHRILKLPRCPACGVRARGLPMVRTWMEPYALASRPEAE
jgi:hypothetical protein